MDKRIIPGKQQTAPTPFPRDPFVFLFATLLSTLAMGLPQPAAAQSTPANSVFIEQLTTNSTVTITQIGDQNIIAGAGTASGDAASLALTLPTPGTDTGEALRIDGDNISLTTEQRGTLNVVGLDVTGANSTISITQTGGSNSSRLFMNGGDNTVTVEISGDSNLSNVELGSTLSSVSNATVTMTVTGDSNKLNLQALPSSSTSATSSYTMEVVGDNNKVKYVNTSLTDAATLNLRLGATGTAANANVISITKGD